MDGSPIVAIGEATEVFEAVEASLDPIADPAVLSQGPQSPSGEPHWVKLYDKLCAKGVANLDRNIEAEA